MKVSNQSQAQAQIQSQSGANSAKGKAGTSKVGSLSDAKSNLKTLAADAEAMGAAKLELSPRAREINRAKEIAKSGPDVDEAKIAKFQQLIDSGKYKVASEDVADRLVDEHVKNAFFDTSE
jgi:flagellar biosynthesis anti-sigma factor FlgM